MLLQKNLTKLKGREQERGKSNKNATTRQTKKQCVE